jgi:hypothetical protein
VRPGFPTENPAVQPIPLAKEAAPDGLKCTVSGWGLVGENEKTLPRILQVVIVQIMTYENCRCRYTSYSERKILPGMNCADFLLKKSDACDVSTASFFT